MVVPAPDPQRILDDVTRLRSAGSLCIDASSMIICNKAGILDPLGACCRLFTVEAVLAETGYTDAPVLLLPAPNTFTPVAPEDSLARALSAADRLLLAGAHAAGLPLVSDDRALLAAAAAAGLVHFNALMMLNLLFAHGAMDGAGGPLEVRRLLLKAGRYHRDVVAYADAVRLAISAGAIGAQSAAAGRAARAGRE
ncbi:MAG: hypothetical protein EA403_17030 [Spirochaetaceae bacterium]|nr:MAG: hypothetical protein EA403_17030 [Spirochaetaceae bacterium]